MHFQGPFSSGFVTFIDILKILYHTQPDCLDVQVLGKWDGDLKVDSNRLDVLYIVHCCYRFDLTIVSDCLTSSVSYIRTCVHVEFRLVHWDKYINCPVVYSTSRVLVITVRRCCKILLLPIRWHSFYIIQIFPVFIHAMNNNYWPKTVSEPLFQWQRGESAPCEIRYYR